MKLRIGGQEIDACACYRKPIYVSCHKLFMGFQSKWLCLCRHILEILNAVLCPTKDGGSYIRGMD